MKKRRKALLMICAAALSLQMAAGSAMTVKADDSRQQIIQEEQKQKVSGRFFISDELVYHVIADNKVEVCGKTKKNKKSVLTIPEKVRYKGKSYTVAQIIDLTAVDKGGYSEFNGEELGSPAYYDEVYSAYEYSSAYKNSMPKGTRKLFAVEVVLPKTITYIGEGAFAGNSTLKKVTFASNYKKLVIGKAAFDRCSLKTIRFPQGTTEIRDYAVDAANIVIPSSVKKIGAGIVDRNTTKVTIAKKNKNFKMKDNLLYTSDETKVLGASSKVAKVVKISSKTTEIAEAAFASGRIKQVNLGGNVKVISAKAFANCGYLKKITGTENLEQIAYGAFYACGSLEEIEDVSKVREIGRASFWRTENMVLPVSAGMQIDDYAFSGCSYGTTFKVTVPENDAVYAIENGLLLKKDGDRKKVLMQTEKMERIVVPEGVTDVMTMLGGSVYGETCICKEVILPKSLKKQWGNIEVTAGNVQFLSETPPEFQTGFWIYCWKETGTLTVPAGCAETYRRAIEEIKKQNHTMYDIGLVMKEA